MKKFLIFVMCCACGVLNAQNISDVLRYSAENLQGTARYQAMGGAFGALGGDLSALNNNPAGSAIFNHGLFTVSGTAYNRDNSASYGGSTMGSSLYDLDINQVGGVMVFNNNQDTSDWNRVSLAFNYDLIQNFENQTELSGSTAQGIDNYFSAFAQGLPLGDILLQDGEFLENAYQDIGAQQGFGDQQAFLGYFGGILDPEAVEDNNTLYNPNAIYENVNQDFLRNTSGYNARYTLNMAAQYRHNLSFGVSLNFHNVLYQQTDFFRETGYASNSPIQSTSFDNSLRTEGAGFSANIGAIGKLNEVVRIGVSYQSPTWYRLEDTFAQRINSDLADTDIQFIDFDIVNIYDRYSIKTPSKLMASLAFVFGKNGLLSADYGYQDMSQARLRPQNDGNFAQVNSDISSQLTAVSSLRVGGEYRIARFSLRAGYRFEQSPYEDGITVGDLTGISGGLGFDFGGSRLDLAVNRTEREMALQLFDAGVTAPATIDRTNTNVTLGYTFNF